MSAVPVNFEQAAHLRNNLEADRKRREQLAFLHLLEDLVREYVRFWHVHICRKPESDLDNYAPVLRPRRVEPGSTPSFFATPFVTDIFLAQNRGGGGVLIQGGGYLWVDEPSRSSRAPIKSEMGGPFPLILHKNSSPRSAEKSYAAWEAGELSSSGRSWEIDSNAVQGFTLPASVTHAAWQYEDGCFGFEHASNPALGHTTVLEQAPEFATKHLLTFYRAGRAYHFEIVFDDPPHHVQARHAGEAFHVLGKSSTRRRY